MAKQPTAAIAAPLNVVVDLSHHNGDVDLQAAAVEGGIVGVIHKGTQGLTYTDPLYETNRKKAEADFMEAANIARRQQARSYELRALNSLCQHRQDRETLGQLSSRSCAVYSRRSLRGAAAESP